MKFIFNLTWNFLYSKNSNEPFPVKSYCIHPLLINSCAIIGIFSSRFLLINRDRWFRNCEVRVKLKSLFKYVCHFVIPGRFCAGRKKYCRWQNRSQHYRDLQKGSFSNLSYGNISMALNAGFYFWRWYLEMIRFLKRIINAVLIHA